MERLIFENSKVKHVRESSELFIYDEIKSVEVVDSIHCYVTFANDLEDCTKCFVANDTMINEVLCKTSEEIQNELKKDQP